MTVRYYNIDVIDLYQRNGRTENCLKFPVAITSLGGGENQIIYTAARLYFYGVVEKNEKSKTKAIKSA